MIDGIRALTVRQPWAWAIAHAGKNIENRGRRTNYRGPLLIHAGAGWSMRGEEDPRILAAFNTFRAAGVATTAYRRSAFIALADLVDCHLGDDGCCDPWGEHTYTRADGRRVTEVWHYVLGDIAALPEPIPCSGQLGLYEPDVVFARAALAQVRPELIP